MSEKKKIRIKFHNCSFIERNFLPILQTRYEVECCDHPDYVFVDYSSREDALDYDCIRIIYIGENCRPDFNLYDYAIGFDAIEYDGRNLQLPLYAMPINQQRIVDAASRKHYEYDPTLLSEKQFCSFLVSNGKDANSAREKMFYEIMNYKHVDSAGKYLNNMPNGYSPATEQQIPFLANYKFNICFENSAYKAYTTEKLLYAFAAGVVPIYWGDPEVDKVFNTKAFVWVKDISEPEIAKAMEQIRYLDQHDEAYLQMMREPIWKNGKQPDFLATSYLEEFLFHIFDVPVQEARKRTNAHTGWGHYYERDMMKLRELNRSRALIRIMKLMGKWYN